MFVYESFARSRSRPASTIAPWSNASAGSSSTGCQLVSAGQLRVDVARHEPEVGGRELPLAAGGGRVAPRLELLEVRELAHVDLRREVAADRLLERLVRVEVAAGKRPAPANGLARPLPEQHLQLARAHLEDDRERHVGGLFSLGGRKPCRLDHSYRL